MKNGCKPSVTAIEARRSIFYAHTLPGRAPGSWELLETHLEKVATLAASFAAAFNADEWGELVGRCHDLGKYSEAFQEYIGRTHDPDAGAGEEIKGRVDHSTFGARYIVEKIGKLQGQLLAFCIAGHHSGLPDATAEEDAHQRRTLKFRLNSKSIPPVRCPEIKAPSIRPRIPIRRDGNIGFQISFFTRMLFSCLIDADRLATEQFCEPEASQMRAHIRPSLRELKDALDAYLGNKQRIAPRTAVNRLRAEVVSQSRQAAEIPPGFFSLNVPTGGGKTLSSLLFALHHAAIHDLHRVVVAIPFTSIIEQNADVYREAFGDYGDRAIIEHHTNIKPERDTRANQLGAENWDAPVIVTTNVQFFESLFAAGTRSCRKLHRLVRSVIILDEAQTIPVELLRPAIAALKELVLNYGCSIVLCTATQPALEKREDFEIGIDRVHQIINQPEAMFKSLRRVEIHYLGKMEADTLVNHLEREDAVLCIVNTRAEAVQIFDGLMKRGLQNCFHLSTWMCGQHRRETLAKVRARLAGGDACRVVSTQLIEAGVNLDFPVVYREIAGFDSIAQASGRCNREGLRPIGRLYVFEGEKIPPAGLLRGAIQTGQELLPNYSADPTAPEAIRTYFQHFYWSKKNGWDKNNVLPNLSAGGSEAFLPLQFREAALRFKMIPDEQTPILIPYDQKSCMTRDQLLSNSDACISERRLQPYLVSVHTPLLRALQEKALIIEHASGIWLLLNSGAYSPLTGLSAEGFGIDASLLVV